jgi:hypothetical protein
LSRALRLASGLERRRRGELGELGELARFPHGALLAGGGAFSPGGEGEGGAPPGGRGRGVLPRGQPMFLGLPVGRKLVNSPNSPNSPSSVSARFHESYRFMRNSCGGQKLLL